MTDKKLKPLMKDGAQLAVVRPADAKKALATAKRIVEDSQAGALSQIEADKQWGAMLHEQVYTYVGICGTAPDNPGDEIPLLNHDHSRIKGDHVRPGDSFVPYKQLMEAGALTAPEKTDA